MKTISLTEMRSYVSVVCYGIIFLFVVLSLIKSFFKHRTVKKTLIKGLSARFVHFQKITESEFVGVSANSGVTFHMTNKEDSILCFKINYPFSIELMHDYIDQILQRAGYLITRLPRHNTNESLATKMRGDTEHTYTISVHEGDVEYSYMIRIDGT